MNAEDKTLFIENMLARTSDSIIKEGKYVCRSNIGVDKMTISLKPISFSYELFDSKKDEEDVKYSVVPAEKRDKALACCRDDRRSAFYSMIRIQKGKDIFICKRNRDDVGDICTLMMFVPNFEADKSFININNETWDERLYRLDLWIRELKATYGFEFDMQSAHLTYIEINTNFPTSKFNCIQFVDFMKKIGGLDAYLKDYKHQRFASSLSTSIKKIGEAESYYNWSIAEGYKHFNKTFALKIYNKSKEIEDKYNAANQRTKLKIPFSVVRMEFCLKTGKLCTNYFGRISVFDITQMQLEDIFQELVMKKILDPLISNDCNLSSNVEKIFESVDISQRNWRQYLINSIDDEIRRIDGNYYYFDINDLKRDVSLIHGKSVAQNKSRIYNSIINEIKKMRPLSFSLNEGNIKPFREICDFLINKIGVEEYELGYTVLDIT